MRSLGKKTTSKGELSLFSGPHNNYCFKLLLLLYQYTYRLFRNHFFNDKAEKMALVQFFMFLKKCKDFKVVDIDWLTLTLQLNLT